ncbi:fructosamine kinase [Curtobacterium sp. MCBD17_013]|uniref:fructosamine kinase family protein n=1 Tax=Curtobacterium sp. MCBD17_013 TaxID=2175668 RepID=UPI000DA8ED09|nr:fructosamine kinase family protein [Curtobacterium sp. MCBD17_013]PZF64489.1 fructosamine kinase [Curtobacterium sp. MCBD17_013]
MAVFTKRRSDAPDGFFAAEAAGLTWLGAAGGVAVAAVLDVGRRHIDLEELSDVRPSPGAARRFGHDLARTHDAGAEAFGAPPEGWDGPTFIGKRPQSCRPSSSWGRFYAEQRVAPFLDLARAAGSVTDDEHAAVGRVLEAVADGALDDDDMAARLHGDLWNGNVVFTPGGVVLIDPAAHGGHRETDLAMLDLFGCPYLDEVVAGYQEHRPLRPGWRERIPLHQLHPLAVHAAGYGRSYGHALVDAARRTAALLR